MSTTIIEPISAKVVYPDSDGMPMSDNTLQFRWITTIQGNLDDLFRDDPLVFVAGDLLWYPVEGNNRIRSAPDTMVAFGRPKGYRGSYRQWDEAGIAPQVVFEVLSPGNRLADLIAKFQFYDRYGVDEYYIYDPDKIELTGYIRDNGSLRVIDEMSGWTSPRLGIRFEMGGEVLVLRRPDGRPFATYLEVCEQAELERQRAEKEGQRAEREHTRAEQERTRAEQERTRAEAERERADRNHIELESARQSVERLQQQMRAAGIEPGSAE